MKKLNKTIIICAVIIITACQGLFKKESGNCVAIIADCSDSFPEIQQDLTLNNLKPLFTITQNPNASAVCLLAKVSDIRHTATSIIKIDGEVAANANLLIREKMRDSFYKRIEENIRNITGSPTGTQGSFVLYAISAMLKKLSECPDCNNSRRLLVFSDLAENNPAVFSVYNKAHLKLLLEKLDSAFAQFDKEYPLLANNKNIEIVFIHRPQNKAADEQYMILSNAFKKYYEGHGYNVTISATIPEE